MRILIFAILLSTSLIGCSAFGKKKEDDKNTRKQSGKSASELYQEAKKRLDKENYIAAIESLELLEAQYPFTPESIEGQLDLIYSHYKTHQTDDVVSAAQRFINLYPQHPKVDYAYYMVGLAHFDQGKGRFERYLSVDMSKRDLGIAKNSFNDFAALLERFPSSSYAADAQKRMVYLRNIMARYEINVANYYFEREAYLAAANRGRYVVENFPQTPAVADGLAVMVQAYTLLGLKREADDALSVLRTNYPEHPSISKKDGTFKIQLTEKEIQRSWLNKLTLGLLDEPSPPKFNNRTPSEH